MTWIKNYIDILQCPCCNGDLELSNELLKCKKCKKTFKIVDNIPILLK
ncbi:Trm112 family protein [Methanothermococcus thermolithotrophicus]|nr:Trm112 family protein [Methanothermococcus thermolithotrophicus]